MLDGNFRKSVETVTLPTGRWMVRIGFSADVLTFSGLVFSFATAWMIALGHFWIAIVLLTLTGFHDLFDGPVAKASCGAESVSTRRRWALILATSSRGLNGFVM